MEPNTIEPVVTHLEVPAGMAGPDPLSIDVRCFIVGGPDGLVLVDAGPPGTAEVVARALERLGAGWPDISDIVLTHRHFDHVGGLLEIVARAPVATVWAGAEDAAAIPVDEGRVVRPLADGDVVRELRVFGTPGHTPGHVSLLHEAMSALLVGDLVGSQDGGAVFGPPAFTADPERSRRSLRRMAELQPGRMLFSHGGEIADPAAAVDRLLASA